MKSKTEITLTIFILQLFCYGHSIYSQNTGSYTFHFPEIKVVTAQSPVILSQVNFTADSETPPAKVNYRIKRIVLNYYFDSGLDSAENLIKLSDVYFNTVKINTGDYSYYITIFKSPAPLRATIFAYNNKLDSVLETEVDYKIHAMYDIIGDKMADSNLKKEFNITFPDIELVNGDSNGTSELKIRRLFHNGTINGKETSVYKIEGKRIVRTYFNLENF